MIECRFVDNPEDAKYCVPHGRMELECVRVELAQAKVDRDRAAEGTEYLRIKVDAMQKVVDEAMAWKKWEPWPYLQGGGSLAHALDALDRLEHHENCDVLDTQIKGKPCNCRKVVS